jgi:cytochrome P450
MKTIYNRSSIKTSFYTNMGSWKGVVTTLGKLDYTSAAPTRNNLLQCFQNRNLDTLTGNIDSHVLKFVEILSNHADTGDNIDGVVWFRLLALDIVTDVLWGDQTDLLGNANTSTPDFLRRFHAFSKYNALKSFIPAVETVVKYFGNSKWRQLRQDCLDMDVTAHEALQKWNQKDTKEHDRDVLSMLSSMQADGTSDSNMPQAHIPAYMVEMMAAGSSTTSHTATFACWALTNHPETQQKLRQELFEAFPDACDLDMRKSQDLPYLNAVIQETMRVWPMIPGPLERYLGAPITVNGLTVPSGVIASTAAYSQGRKEDVYKHANEWLPDRWLNADERMKLNWTPFGHGSRICPGSNLAMTELRYMLCVIFRNLRAVQPIGHENEPIEMMDVFAAGTKSGVCWLRFERDVGTSQERAL